jgi:hypothetical protein
MSPSVTALLVRLAVGLVLIVLVYVGLRLFDASASHETVNIAISAVALVTLVAPTRWFKR